MPARVRTTEKALTDLFAFIRSARTKPSRVLRTGLTDAETRELLQTQNTVVAVKLVRKGLIQMGKLPPLAA